LNFVDDLERTITLEKYPERIISLVPSITELLYDLGLEEKIVAVTRFCKYPQDKLREKEKVGGTKDFDLQKIRFLNPDLIIAVKEENNKDLILEIAKEIPVYILDITDISSALRSILKIGGITNTAAKAQVLHQQIQKKIKDFSYRIEKKVCYLIWEKPIMTIAANTFISGMLQLAGYSNVFSDKKEHYFSVTVEEIQEKEPDFIFLSSEPYPFKEKHQKQFEQQFPNIKVVLVDGEMFTWYGSRMLKAVDYFTVLNKKIVQI